MERWDVRHPDDDRALALLRMLGTGVTPERIARELMRLSRSMDVDARIAVDAVHAAAEASTDGSYDRAVEVWESLLREHDTLGTSSANEVVTGSLSFGGASVQRLSMKLTAAAG